MTQLFPDMDLSRFTDGAVQDGGSPVTSPDPFGVMAGLNATLLAWLANFTPGDTGVFHLNDKLQLSLPVPHWSEWSWVQGGASPSIDAGSSDPVVLWTLPSDERALLHAMYVSRATGDNNVDIFSLTMPEGYYSGSSDLRMLNLDTSASSAFWPHEGSQTIDNYIKPPVLCEPGTGVNLGPAGVGVAASTFSFTLFMTRTKIVRAMAP